MALCGISWDIYCISYLLRVAVDIARDETRDGVTMVLPVLRSVSVRDGSQLSRSNKHVGIKDDQAHRNNTNHEVVMEHILKFVILPSEIAKIAVKVMCVEIDCNAKYSNRDILNVYEMTNK